MFALPKVFAPKRATRPTQLLRSSQIFRRIGLPHPGKDGRSKIVAALEANAAGPRHPRFLGVKGGDLLSSETVLLPPKPNPWREHALNALFEGTDVFGGALTNRKRWALRLLRFDDVCLMADGVSFAIWRGNTISKQSNGYFHALRDTRAQDAVPMGTGAFIDDRFRVTNPCHFMVDRMPRIRQLNALGKFAEADCVTVTKGAPYAEFVLGKLAPGVRVMEAEVPYHFDTLYLLSTSAQPKGHPFFYFDEDVIDWFMPKVTEGLPPASAGRKVYLSRLATPRRRLVNEKSLVRRLKRRGFEILEMSDYPPPEQLATLRSADLVVAPHGAALANLIGASAQTRVVEIMNVDKATSVYAGLSMVVGAGYSRVFGKSLAPTNPEDDRWRVDLDAVEAAIDQEPQYAPAEGLVGRARTGG